MTSIFALSPVKFLRARNVFYHILWRFFLLLICTFSTSASLAIFNGVVPGGNHPDFPAVVKLLTTKDGKDFMCTGVFISPTAALTAAHCLADEDKGGLLIFGTSHRSEAVEVADGIFKALQTSKENVPANLVKFDLAVVFFPAGANSHAMELTPLALPLTSVPVILSGFGAFALGQASLTDAQAIKRVGYNKIYGLIENNSKFLVKGTFDSTTDGSNASPMGGDSGGPLIDAASKKLLGILSGTKKNDVDKEFINEYASLYSQESIDLIEKAALKRSGEIPQAFLDALRPAAPTSMSDPSDPASLTPAPGAPTPAPMPATPAPMPATPAPMPATPAPMPATPAPMPATPAPMPATPAPGGPPATPSPMVGYRPQPKSHSDFLQLDERLAQEITSKSRVQIKAGLVYTNQSETDGRSDLTGALVGEVAVDLLGDGNERARLGYSVDNPKELWLITLGNLRYLISNDQTQNLLVESLRHFIPVPKGVVYFDENWLTHFVSFNGKTKHSFDLRVYTRDLGNGSGQIPIYHFEPSEKKLILAHWNFLPAGQVKKDAPAPDDAEISLIDFSTATSSEGVPIEVLTLESSAVWPFYLRSNGIFEFSKDENALDFRALDYSSNLLASPKRLLTLEGDYEIKEVNGELGLVRLNPSGRPTPLIIDSEGRLSRKTGRSDRFNSVADQMDRALSGLPIEPPIRDLLELPRRAPTYLSPALNADLSRVLGGARNTWAIVTYEDGQMPEEVLSGFAQKLGNGSLAGASSLKSVERIWRIPGATAFNSTDPEELEIVFTTIFQAVAGTRSIGYFADFPTKRAEAVSNYGEMLESFWGYFEDCLGDGSCRVVTTMRSSVYQELKKLYPDVLDNATIIEIPRLDSQQRKLAAQSIRRQLEQEYGRTLTSTAFDQVIKFSSTSTKGKQSPEKEELLLRSLFDWADQNAKGAEIASSDVQQFLNRNRTTNQSTPIDIEGLRQHLYKNMVGHREVIDQICDMLKPLENGTHFGPKPIYFTLLGTPGVGKSRLTNLIANYLTGQDSNLLIDFKNFQGFDAGSALGALQKIKSSPEKLHVVTLDDVDRATFNDLDSFRGVFDNGFYAKGTPQEVPFTNTVVILTANWGEKLILQDSGFEGSNFLESLRRDIVVDESKSTEDANPRGKISNRVWRVLAGKMLVMRPFTEENLLQLALMFCDERSAALSARSGDKKVWIHPMVLLKFISVKDAATAGASDIQNALDSEVFPVYESAIATKGISQIVLVPVRGKVQAVTNQDRNFSLWKKSYDNAREVIKEKGGEWFVKNADQWFRDDMKKINVGGKK